MALEIMDQVSSVDRREIDRVMFDEVLEKNSYPTAVYESSRVNATKSGENMFRINVAGNLTLHGVTREVALDAQIVAGEDTLRAQGLFPLCSLTMGLGLHA